MDPLLRLYLILFPVSYLAVIPLAGARGTVADLVLLVLVGAWGVAGITGKLVDMRDVNAGPSRRRVIPPGMALPVLCLLAYSAWVAVSGLWGFHPEYALIKGGGAAALTFLVVVIARHGRPQQSAVADAWLEGAALAVAFTLVFLAVGPGTRGVVTYQGGASLLALPRVSGTFGHPNLFGDWLVASGVLLWARWPAWRARGSPALRQHGAIPLAVALGGLLVFTASTAWAVAGLALLILPFTEVSRGRRRILRVAGGVLMVATIAGAFIPLQLGSDSSSVTTSGVRPAVWMSAARAFQEAPVIGVGAAPYLAQAADPVRPEAGELLWDAHSLPLSLLGQFGVVGFLLFVVGTLLIALRLRMDAHAEIGDGPRLRMALVVLVAGMVLQAFVTASEDVRHMWIILGMVGGWGVWRKRTPRPEATPQVEAVVEELDGVEWESGVEE